MPVVDRIVLVLATLGPFGRAPKAPGTWGSLAALLIAPLFLRLPISGRLALLAALFPLGAWCAGRAEQLLSRKDPSCVVIDELWGQWIALLFLPVPHIPWMLAAFALFRFFDIAKPGPIFASQTWLPGGWGVMLDDGIAGIFALAILSLANMLL